MELTCKEDQKKALQKDKEYMGERWVTVNESNWADMEADMENATKAKRNGFLIVVVIYHHNANSRNVSNYVKL